MKPEFNTFSAIKEVRELFDLAPLTDMREVEGKFQSVVSIGQRYDYSAGLHGFTVTPYFDTLPELEAFCQKHIERFREIAKDEDAPTPDATGWEI
jgi:hypothetical protein